MARKLKAHELCRRCAADELDFDSTAELEGDVESIGQERALEALRFGLKMRGQGWNLFVLGPPGSGRNTLVERVVRPIAAEPTEVSAWCYVHNFAEPHKPKLLRLPPGRGYALARDMKDLVEELRTSIPAVFESDEYRARKNEIDTEYKNTQEEAFKKLSEEAESHNIRLLHTPMGFAMAPTRDGEIVTPDDFEKLPEEERKAIEAVVERLQEQLTEIIRRTPILKRDAQRKLKELDREMTAFAAQHLMDERRNKHSAEPSVLEYLDAVQEDVVEHADDLRQAQVPQPQASPFAPKPSFERYEINVLVDDDKSADDKKPADKKTKKTKKDTGDKRPAPVVKELNPSFENLVGRIEHRSQFGTLFTDFRLIMPGALHRANGGYLVLDARRLLMHPYAWEALKRALSGREIVVESAARMLGLAGTVSLEPEPTPLDVKVVLIGTRDIYYLLQAYDPDFDSLFKVAVDFENDIARSADNISEYARLLAAMVREKELLPLDRAAVARVVEHTARLADDSEKLSVRLGRIEDLLREADYRARDKGSEVIRRDDVQEALDQAERRLSRIKERIQESISRETIFIDTVGEVVGQINALSVLQLGAFRFGQPNRITATARLGDGRVVDIEREVKLGGAFHSKGVLILSSFLASRYAKDRPLSLRASLVFEQNYGRVDGDSASMAELCALLSALANLPIKQSLAITGSVNQRGQAQPIGGVNEKIEGFFEVCLERGLSGEQGVMIPAANIKHLVLKEQVVEAVKKGDFHIYAYRDVDEAISLLTGATAGERDAEGTWPEGSVNALVEQRVEQLSEIRRKLAKTGGGKTNDTDDENNGDDTDDEDKSDDKDKKEAGR